MVHRVLLANAVTAALEADPVAGAARSRLELCWHLPLPAARLVVVPVGLARLLVLVGQPRPVLLQADRLVVQREERPGSGGSGSGSSDLVVLQAERGMRVSDTNRQTDRQTDRSGIYLGGCGRCGGGVLVIAYAVCL